MKKIKKSPIIYFIHFNNGFSGSPKMLRLVINALDAEQKVLITNKSDGFLSDVDIPVLNFDFTLSNSNLKTLYRYFRAQLSLFFLVIKNCKQGDLLYINTVIPMFASFAGRIKRARLIFHIHEDRSSLNFVHKSLSSLRKYFCDVEIFVSDYLKTREHIPGKVNYILHNVVPEKFFNFAINYKRHYQEYNFNVLMICSLKKYKGVNEFVDIAKKLGGHQNINFSLLVSDTRNNIDSFFKDVSLPSNLTVYEQSSDTEKFYQNASILLNLSRPDEWIETYGLTILEGMTFGLPCIVPPIGGPVELIEENKNGFKISCYDTHLISETILKLSKDKSLWESMSSEARTRAKQFDYSTFKGKLNSMVYTNMGYDEV